MKPNVVVGIAAIGAIGAGTFFAMTQLWNSLFHEFNALQFVVCILATAVLGRITVLGFEDLFTSLDECGVRQMRIISGRKIFARSFISWNDVESFSMLWLVCHLRGKGPPARINLNFFNNAEEALEFLRAHLPPGKMDEISEADLTTVNSDVVARWIMLCSIAAAGSWFIIDGAALNDYVNTRICGAVIVVASIMKAARILESASVRMDEAGLEQIKVVHRGKFFARHRLSWQDVAALVPRWDSICFDGKDARIRIDGSYFGDRDKVFRFANEHLPERLRSTLPT